MFIEKPAKKQSLEQRKPVFGVGINDADYVTSPKINGKRVFCPFYKAWKSMLFRCYDESYRARNPTYHDCTVFDGWLVLSEFKSWMKTQDWTGKCLDKDIIKPGNKMYHPDYCVFVTTAINNLLSPSVKAGNLPRGVVVEVGCKTFRVSIYKDGARESLGNHKTIDEAAAAYVVAKSSHILDVASRQSDQRVRDGLIKHAELLISSIQKR